MGLAASAADTLRILDEGSYLAPSGARVALGARVARAVAGTVLYRPDDFTRPPLAACDGAAARDASPTRLEVTAESTAQAAARLVAAEGVRHVLALNFASAKNPGGGFLGGAKAQEEDLARCSALYPCQLTQRAYYDANRACASMLYTDHMIYSPDVPFFRDDHLRLLEEPFELSVLTAPAPNAGEHLRRHADDTAALTATLDARASKVLAVARAHGHRTLVLGAWGCGVFRNDPSVVADLFAKHLAGTFAGAFERVVFAVYDRKAGSPTLAAFRARFTGVTTSALP